MSGFWNLHMRGSLKTILALCLFMATATAAPPEPAKGTVAGLPAEKALALGERMYREGILPNGEPIQSVVSGDIPVAGTAISCQSCHVRSGVGSYEGGIVTLATNGAKLAQPRYWKFPNMSQEERKGLKLQYPEARPAYTNATLAHLISTGIDPVGREMHLVMPRYSLNDQDMALLVNYLWTLSARLSPGVDPDTVHLATVITDEVSAEDQEAMLVPMNNFVAHHNVAPNGFANRMYLSMGGQEMSGAYRKLALSVWRLKGSPDTWGRQLEAYLAKEPVFALLGGISYREWRPIHTFCETHQLPCLFPLTDLPVVSATDWYTQYFSKGYYQEGQAAARYLHSLDDQAGQGPLLQIVQDGPEGRDLATGFRETQQELGLGAAKEVRLKKGETLSAARLRTLLQQEHPGAVLLWAGPDAFQALSAVAEQAERPARIFLSSRLLGQKVLAVPDQARPFTFLTYPYRDPKDEPIVSRYANPLLAGLSKHRPETRVSTRAYSMLQIFQAAFIDIDRNVYRDNLLDRIGMMQDYLLPDYLRLSFGPGQRYASKGCFIMQLSPGPDPKLIRKSDWVIH